MESPSIMTKLEQTQFQVGCIVCDNGISLNDNQCHGCGEPVEAVGLSVKQIFAYLFEPIDVKLPQSYIMSQTPP